MTTLPKFLIYHISDIHICAELHENIAHAIEQICARARAETIPIIVVIAGDIFEHKNKVSQHDLDCFHNILTKLLSFAVKIITIPGAHDFSANAGSRDLISAALAGDIPKVYHYPQSGVHAHQVAGMSINFHILSPIDKEIPALNSLSASQVAQDKSLNIAIMHEEIGEENRFTIAKLCKYDIVMAGFSHKPHFLSNSIAYCGSLVQKNCGEDVHHGFIRWSISEKPSGEIILLNLRNALITILAENNKIIKKPQRKYIDTISFVQLLHNNCSSTFVNDARAKIIEAFGRIDLVKNMVQRITTNISANQNMLEDILYNDPNKQKILDLHNEWLAKTQDSLTIKKWRINYLAWSNVFCYGEDNFLSFRDLRGIASLIGKNGVGKSTIIDMIFFALYNDRIRGAGINFCNWNSRSYKITCSITQIESGNEYIIERTGDSVRHMGARLILRRDQHAEDITECDVSSTYDQLGKIIGSSTELERCNIALQDHTLYVNKTCNELRQQFLKYLGLEQITKIAVEIRQIILEKNRVIKAAQKIISDVLSRHTHPGDESIEPLKSVEQLESEYAHIEYEIDTMQKSLNELYAQIVPLNAEVHVTRGLSAQECKDALNANNQKIESLLVQKSSCANPKNIILAAGKCTDTSKHPAKIIILNEKIRELTSIAGLESAEVAELRAKHAAAKVECSAISAPEKILRLTDCAEEELDKILSKPPAITNTIFTARPNVPLAKLEQLRSKIDTQGDLRKFCNFAMKNCQFAANCVECQHNLEWITKTNEKNSRDATDLAQIDSMIEQHARADAYEYHCAVNDKKYFENARKEARLAELSRELDTLAQQIAERTIHAREKCEAQIAAHKSAIKVLQGEIIAQKDMELDKQIAQLKSENENLRSQIAFHETRAARENNARIDAQIAAIKQKLNESCAAQTISRRKINDMHTARAHREQVDALEAEIATTRAELEPLEQYAASINEKTGLPHILARKYIHALQSSINDILTQITNFQVALQIDDRGGLHILTEQGPCHEQESRTQNAVQVSGSQKFMIDLAIRMCLARNHPFLPGFLIVDEGFGCMDARHLANMRDFLSGLRSYFEKTDFIMIISHIDELHSAADIDISISVKDDRSYLVFGEPNVLDLSVIPQKEIVTDAGDIIEVGEKYHCTVCKKDYMKKNGFIEKHIKTETHLRNVRRTASKVKK